MSASAINYQLGAAYQGKFAEVRDVATGGTYDFTGTRSHLICSSSGAGTKKIPNAAPGTEFVVIASGTLSLTTLAGTAIITIVSGQSVVLRANSTTSWQVVGGSFLLTNLQSTQGFIDLPLSTWRGVVSNDIGVVADGANRGSCTVLGTDSLPAYEYANGDTDSQHRILWVANGVIPITTQFTLPPDLDRTADLVLKMRATSGATDLIAVTCESFFDEGDTKVSDTFTTIAEGASNVTATIAAADVPDTATTVSVELTPGAHAADSLIVYAIWATYTKKLLTS